MLSKSNLEMLVNLENIKDVVIIGRFSDDGDDNDIIIYGFADPEQASNGRMLKMEEDHSGLINGNKGVNLVYSSASIINETLVEPVYPVIKPVNNFIVAGNGLHIVNTCISAKNYGFADNKNPAGGLLQLAGKNDCEYYDMNGNSLKINKFKPDIYLTPRIQGVVYAPYKIEDSAAAFAVSGASRRFNSFNTVIGFSLGRNQAKMVATVYDSKHVFVPVDLDFSGWDKFYEDAQEFQKKLTNLIFECMGPTAVGVVSMLGYLKSEYVINKKGEI